MTDKEYINRIILCAKNEMKSAIDNYPQPNFVALKLAEECGEAVKAAVHYTEDRETWENVEKEVIQTIAMCLRLLVEGDQVNGIIPPSRSTAND